MLVLAPAEAAAAQGRPQTGLSVIPLTVRTQAGGVHRFQVELARSIEEQATGMMWRRSAPRGTGMLFPRIPPAPAAFWMRNTLIPLDIIYIAPGGRIESIAASATPLSEAPIPSMGPVEAVLELAGGEAARLRIRPGDRVEWTR